MATPAQQLKCLLLPLADERLLVPNALVAEIITQQAVVQRDGAADWLLGTGSWRGTEIPLISFERLCGRSDSRADPAGRYVVLFSLEADRAPQYYGIRIEALPRSETVDGERLQSGDRDADDPAVIATRGRLGDRDCIIPDLDRLVSAIREEMGAPASDAQSG